MILKNILNQDQDGHFFIKDYSTDKFVFYFQV